MKYYCCSAVSRKDKRGPTYNKVVYLKELVLAIIVKKELVVANSSGRISNSSSSTVVL